MAEEIFIRFVLDHENDDPARLLLSAERWPEVDVRRAARIIEARRKIKEKVPSWYALPALDYPGSLPLEQCSSEATARYKQAFVPKGGRIVDLTGGLGVDFLALAAYAAEAHYCERDEALCTAARHNFPIVMPGLGGQLHIHAGDGVEWLRRQGSRFDLVYLDPARRDASARRVYDIALCEPNLLAVKDLLLSRADRVLAKISPMADIARTLQQVPETRKLHVVATGGEVKELLLLMEPGEGPAKIVAADDGHTFSFTPDEECNATVRYADGIGKYLFQPSKALRKAGAFRLPAQRFGLAKLATSTHLYTGDAPVENFPGKCFAVEEVLDWNRTVRKTLRDRYPRLEMTALNFPLATEALRSQLGIAEGGDRHLFATTLHDKQKILIICNI